MKKVYFITGASGVGKTSLVSSLKEKFKNKKNWIFLYFDSIDIPTQKEMIEQFGSVENWQKEKTFEWIKKIIGEYKDKEIIIFEGQVNLQFIKDGFAENNFSNYEIILVDCNEDVMGKRLLKYRNQPDLVNENMKNWLIYLRNQARNFNTPIIDTSDRTKDEVTKEFMKILVKNYKD